MAVFDGLLWVGLTLLSAVVMDIGRNGRLPTKAECGCLPASSPYSQTRPFAYKVWVTRISLYLVSGLSITDPELKLISIQVWTSFVLRFLSLYH
jgi:hypothetical protein